MPRQIMWLLRNDVPAIEVFLRNSFTGQWELRTLLADTGAGPRFAPFELVLSHADIERFGEQQSGEAGVSGALQGRLAVHRVHLRIPALQIARSADALSAPSEALLANLDGIAAFRFLCGFSYGNFGSATEFGLETR